MSKLSERKCQAVVDQLIAILASERKRLGLSFNEIAARSGLDHTMVMRVEKMERMPTILTLLRIADAMGVDLWKKLREATNAESAS